MTYSTHTGDGRTCHTGLTSRREAEMKAAAWAVLFPEHSPYTVHGKG